MGEIETLDVDYTEQHAFAETMQRRLADATIRRGRSTRRPRLDDRVRILQLLPERNLPYLRAETQLT